MKKIILIVAGVVLVAGIGVGAALFLLGGDEEVATQEGEAGVAADDKPKVKPPIYVGLDPDFVVAFQNPKHARFIKASVEVMTRDSDVEDAIKHHMPAIRDSVLMLLSVQDEEELASPEGKEKFRADILAAVQQVIQAQTGDPGVEAVYFTNFVMQ